MEVHHPHFSEAFCLWFPRDLQHLNHLCLPLSWGFSHLMKTLCVYVHVYVCVLGIGDTVCVCVCMLVAFSVSVSKLEFLGSVSPAMCLWCAECEVCNVMNDCLAVRYINYQNLESQYHIFIPFCPCGPNTSLYQLLPELFKLACSKGFTKLSLYSNVYNLYKTARDAILALVTYPSTSLYLLFCSQTALFLIGT
jgi:hypothetical protein